MHESGALLAQLQGGDGNGTARICQQAAPDLAKRLLLTSDRLLVDIAYATGFSSQANFNRAFRRAVGTTPSTYRAQKSAARNCK